MGKIEGAALASRQGQWRHAWQGMLFLPELLPRRPAAVIIGVLAEPEATADLTNSAARPYGPPRTSPRLRLLLPVSRGKAAGRRLSPGTGLLERDLFEVLHMAVAVGTEQL